MTYLFVYGIFKRHGAGSYMLTTRCEFIGLATAPGFLILNHNGPAAMVPGNNFHAHKKDYVAKGEVLSIPDEYLEKMLNVLDHVESNGTAYIRAKIEVVLENGRRIEAYTYLYMNYYGQGEILADGSWNRSFCKKCFDE